MQEVKGFTDEIGRSRTWNGKRFLRTHDRSLVAVAHRSMYHSWRGVVRRDPVVRALVLPCPYAGRVGAAFAGARIYRPAATDVL